VQWKSGYLPRKALAAVTRIIRSRRSSASSSPLGPALDRYISLPQSTITQASCDHQLYFEGEFRNPTEESIKHICHTDQVTGASPSKLGRDKSTRRLTSNKGVLQASNQPPVKHTLNTERVDPSYLDTTYTQHAPRTYTRSGIRGVHLRSGKVLESPSRKCALA
jgi:hypothetical protein